MTISRYPTKLFDSYDAWAAAGRPVGGIMPIERPYPHAASVPARYAEVWPRFYVALPDLPERSGVQLWCPWHRAFDKEKGLHGEGWEIKGPPERMTVTPSIKTDNYHGFLTDGVLVACGDSKL